ncbi:MAG: hypothetical protein LBE37_05590 [Sphingobacterium sp.]|jgi:hypothetical protein|nr:hypothetical protein [Sphingobacterium sp.]
MLIQIWFANIEIRFVNDIPAVEQIIIRFANRTKEVYSYLDRHSIELRFRNDACIWMFFKNFSATEQHFEYQNHKTYIKLLDTATLQAIVLR